MGGTFVAVEGPTGAGKTTVAARLAAVLHATVVCDPFEDNPFLPQLAASVRPAVGLALRVELTFFALRVAQLRRVDAVLADGESVVADWALIKQPIFAATTLHPEDAARVAATVEVWVPSLPTPDLLIGLSASTSVLRGRVRRRGRGMEADLTGVQLAALSDAFDAAYARWPGPLLRVDTDTFDAFDDRHLSELADQVRQLMAFLESPCENPLLPSSAVPPRRGRCAGGC